MEHEHGDTVLPGEKLCTCEEYVSSNWTYLDNNGFIRSSIEGKIVIDENKRTISIFSNEEVPRHLDIGSVVIGYVTEVKPHKVLVTIKKDIDSNRDLVIGYNGYVHISKVTDGYVSSMYDLFHIGDIIKAKVVNILGLEYVELMTVSDELGIIKAMCVDCRKFMQLDKTGQLVCECGKIDVRKISSNYGGLL